MKLRIYKEKTLWFIGYGAGIANPREVPCLTFEQAVVGVNAVIAGKWMII